MIMNKKNYLSMALLAVMLTAVSCGSDEDEIDPAVKNFVESTTFTDEELTGFEPLGIQGEWEMPTYYVTEGTVGGVGGTTTAKTATLFFNDKGKVRVVASHDDAFFLPTGVYNYSVDKNEGTLMMNGTRFSYTIVQGYLSVVYSDSKRSYSHSFARKPIGQAVVPGFFEQFENRDAYEMPPFEFNEWRTAFYAINSQDELEQLLVTDKSIPQIDFSQYTLVSGNITIYNGMLAKGMELQEEDGVYRLHIYIDNYNPHGYGTQEPRPYFFWRLYPKLDKEVSLQIEENIIEN